MDLNQFLQWLITAFLGAAIVKLLDLAFNRYLKRTSRKEENIDKLSAFLNDYGELVELYRFMAEVSSHMVKDETGEYVQDKDGKYLVESKVLEPKEKFESAIQELQDANFGNAITQKIATIRLKSAEAQDVSLIIDPSGDLKELLTKLYLDTIYSIDMVIKYKDMGNPIDAFNKMIRALGKADETRRNIRVKLHQYLNK